MKALHIVFPLFLMTTFATAQSGQVAADTARWEITTDVNLYFIPDDFFVDPVIGADHNRLHLEGRYNWEARNTFSAWIGRNYSGGRKFEYKFTPMIGVVVGNSNGVSPGLEFSISRNRFELTSTLQFMFDTDGKENNYFYDWSDLTYSIRDWLQAGFSVQRTRLYQTNLDIQRGIVIGGSHKNFGISVYIFNIGFDRAYSVVTASMNF